MATKRDDKTPHYLMPEAAGDGFGLHLPQAEVRRYWVSCFAHPSMLEKFAIYSQLGSDQKKQAEQGISWMLMPYRELTVVHAVSQPLDPPGFISFTDKPRKENETFVNLASEFLVHSKSTGKLDVSAQWDDFTDDPNSDADPTVGIKRQAHVKERHIETGLDDVRLDMVQSFHDTKHRNVTYTATATTRFREYFDDPAPPGLSFTSDSTELDRDGSPLVHNILSTARPAAPKVLYIIPAFRWSLPPQPDPEVRASNILESVRQGGGLRVYLDRPWYSSGEGEALGIVMARQSLGTVPAELQKLVTCWGSDPVWPSEQPQNQANQFQFQGGAQYFTEVQLDETSQKVDVAVYPVGWDGVRKLWYADLQIDVNRTVKGTASGFTYFPFIRLALVRFQADSLSNLRASRVVLMDAVQVVPARTLNLGFHSLELDGVKLDHVTITVSGGQQSLQPYDRNRWQVFFETTVDGQPPTGDFDWTRLGEDVGEGPAADGQSLFKATVPLPKPRSSVPMRVVVQESEWYNSPDWIQDSQAGGTGARVVYADALEF